jgi:hypothetical protein
MFIKIPGAASNVVVAYKTLMCATVGTLRRCFLFPLTIMTAFCTDTGAHMAKLEE